MALALGFWEYSLRKQGVGIVYDETAAPWSNKRAMVYEPADKTTVFIGSFWIKYVLDIPAWEHLISMRFSFLVKAPYLLVFQGWCLRDRLISAMAAASHQSDCTPANAVTQSGKTRS